MLKKSYILMAAALAVCSISQSAQGSQAEGEKRYQNCVKNCETIYSNAKEKMSKMKFNNSNEEFKMDVAIDEQFSKCLERCEGMHGK